MPAPLRPTTPTRSPRQSVKLRSASTISSSKQRGEVARLDHLLPAALAGLEAQAHLAPFEDGPLDLLHPVNLALLVHRLLLVPLVQHHVCPEREARDGLLQPLDLLLLRDVVLLLLEERSSRCVM